MAWPSRVGTAVRSSAFGDELRGAGGGPSMGDAAPREGEPLTICGVELTRPRRLLDADNGITKLELARYYCDHAERVLPHLAGRPFALVSAPDGLAGEQFFLRHPHTLTIPGLRRMKAAGGDVMEIHSEQALVAAVQMGTIEFHTWNADRRQVDRPDRMVLDLDPGPLLPWSDLIAATHHLLDELDGLGLPGFIKTSGCRGLHVVVPLARHHGWVYVREFGRAVVQHLVRAHPRCFTEAREVADRIGRIYIDYTRNQRGSTTVAAYSVRARPGLPVSVPIARDELDALKSSSQWNVGNLSQRLASLRGDPWEGYANTRRITQAMKERLGMQA